MNSTALNPAALNPAALNAAALRSASLHTTQLRPARRIVSTYHAGLTTRSQLAAVASATVTLFVLGQLLLRWIVL